MADMNEPGQPMWWVKRLEKSLTSRRAEMDLYDDYYEGKHPLAFASPRFLQSFGGMFERFSDNWSGVVVDAERERLHVEGFRFGDNPKADADAWANWQRNGLDADSGIGHTEALVHGEAAALVWAGGDGRPVITVEHPKEMIVEHAAGSRRERAAALKLFTDSDGLKCCTLYLPTAIYKFKGRGITGATWERRDEANEPWPLPNPLGVVPVVPLRNRPRILTPYTSELKNVIPLQNGVNKLLADMLVASEFCAFKQRWATGIDIEVDADGKPSAPWRIAMDRIITSPAVDTKFGDFESSDLSNFVSAIDLLVKHIATQSRTPQHYFAQAGPQPSGESIKSAETGLVAKAKAQAKFFGEAWEEVMRLAFAVEDDPRAEQWDAETLWGDMESRSESEHVDATLKKQALEVPRQQLWEDLGYSPSQITRFKAMQADDQLRGVMAGGPQFGAPVAVPAGRLPARPAA